MKTRFFRILLMVLVSTMITGSLTTFAQTPGETKPPPRPEFLEHERKIGEQPRMQFLDGQLLNRAGEDAPGERSAAPDFNLGQPGLSYRYLQTFGVSESPYPEDTLHLNHPIGLAFNNSDELWVAEEDGFRLLKYSSGGAHLQTLGHLGRSFHHEDYLSYPKEVLLDPSGDIWVLIDPALKKFDASGNVLQIFPEVDPWVQGSANDRFRQPRGLAMDSAGRLYVSDEGNHRVQVYTFAIDGTPVYSTTVGITGEAGADNLHFNTPSQIVIDSLNRLYVLDNENFRLQRCRYTSGWTCGTFHGTGVEGGGSSQLSWAYGLGIDASDNIFIADSGNGRIKKCTSAGSCTVLISGLSWPADAAISSANDIYVSDYGANVIEKFNQSGVLQSIFKGVPWVPYVPDTQRLNHPWGVAVAADGSIYTTEQWGYRLIKMNSSGEQLWSIGQAGIFGEDNAHFCDFWSGLEGNPAVDALGRVYVSDTSNQRVQVFNPDGSYFDILGVTRETGSDNAHFDCPAGVAINPLNGDIVVVDHCNQRLQVFDSNRNYKTTLGVVGQVGTDNAHFNWPWGAAVDQAGYIYVADYENNRVQKCSYSSSSYSCSTFAGETGVWDWALNHMNPISVAVDKAGRVYVVNEGADRVVVFDSSGALLTVVGGEWSAQTGGLRQPSGVAVDQAGNLYVADRINHRIQKYAPGVPNWLQVNINGFGDITNGNLHTLAGFNGQLYAGTYNDAWGAQLWRWNSGSPWQKVDGDGLGDADNIGFNHLLPFGSHLYLAVRNDWDGGRIYRSADGSSWGTPVVESGLTHVDNFGVYRLEEFGGKVYAGTGNWSTGGQIWRSDNGNVGTWSTVLADGYDSKHHYIMRTSEVHNGNLYFGTQNTNIDTWDATYGGAVLRSSSGDSGSWIKVNNNGFGDPNNFTISGLVSFNGYLYASTTRWEWHGVEVWRCQACTVQGDWQRVVDNGFSNPDNWGWSTLQAFDGMLYLVIGNELSGMQVWRSATGNSGEWEQVGFAGYGDSENDSPYFNNVTVFNNNLFVGTSNIAQGPEIWEFLHEWTFLPIAVR